MDIIALGVDQYADLVPYIYVITHCQVHFHQSGCCGQCTYVHEGRRSAGSTYAGIREEKKRGPVM